MDKKDLLVLGIGNLILGDEGVGIHVVKALKRDKTFSLDAIDGGTAGLTLMPIMQSYSKVIVVDAGIGYGKVGTIRHIKPKFAFNYPSIITIHEIGLKDVIDAMKINSFCPEIEMIVITVSREQAISMKLSYNILVLLPSIINLIKAVVAN